MMTFAHSVGVLAALLLLSGAGEAQELRTVKIGVVNLSTDIAFYLAEKRDYFKEEGLKAELAYFDSGAKMILPLGTGDLAAGGGAASAGLYNAVDRGIELRVVADKGMSVDGYDYKALVVRKDLVEGGAFKSLADLKGRKVAIVAQGVADESILHQALLKGGLKDSDIDRVYVPFSQQLVALQNKGIDAAIAGEKKSLQGRLIDGRYHGLAAVPFVESGGSGKENARLAVEPDGSVTVYVGSSVLGQGLETTLAQVAADTLELPFERVRVLHGSTRYVREGFGTFASRSMVVGGSAVLDGCNNLIAAIRAAATERFGLPNEEITIADGVVSAGAKRAGFAEFAGLEAEGTFATTVRTYSYGAHACHVAVDPRTGHVDILDYVAIEDVGRAINPSIVHGQAIGALVQGLGGVFLDEVVYDRDAQILNASLADYLVPFASDFPNVRAITLELRRSRTNPLGAKGAGEGGMVAVAATAANAVAAALAPLSVELRELPLTPAGLWKLLEGRGPAPAADKPQGQGVP